MINALKMLFPTREYFKHKRCLHRMFRIAFLVKFKEACPSVVPRGSLSADLAAHIRSKKWK